MDIISLGKLLNNLSRKELIEMIGEYNQVLLENSIEFESKIKPSEEKIQDKLHLLKPKQKKEFLSEFKQIITNSHPISSPLRKYTIENFATQLAFVGISADKINFYSQKGRKKLVSKTYNDYWADDPWFAHLSELQLEASRSDEFNNENIFSVLHCFSVVYCMLIRYKTDDKKDKHFKYQLYLGQQRNTARWDRSGVNHLSQVRNILGGKSGDFSVCDLCLTYFGPKNAIVFTIDQATSEGYLSKNFPHYNGEVLDLTTDKLSLSPKKGDN